jgi:extracellular elastinolytic metalloproteinase
VEHAYANQVLNGIPVVNVNANVAFGPEGHVVSFGHNFVKPSTFPP